METGKTLYNYGLLIREEKIKKTIFLDRDGVINHDTNYVTSWSKFCFIPGSLEALRLLNENGFTSIIITNQSAIGRNMMTVNKLDRIHARMKYFIESSGGKITDIFYCPHLPDDGCDCRKPLSGLLYKAQGKYNIDLSSSTMIGDSAKDIECGLNAGCKTILVLPKKGAVTSTITSTGLIYPEYIFKNLLMAVEYIVGRYHANRHRE